MNVFIVGGTGFLGYHATLEFLKRGHSVNTISLPDIPLGDWYPKDQVNIQFADIFEMNHSELMELFKGFDALVYAVGPDDRIVPDAPAYDFYYDRLVKSCGRVMKGALDAGIKRVAICNSYFPYFDRTYPELHLADHHPYIKCRVEQASHCIEIGGDQMDVMIMELPYIFGTMPERVPLWKEVIIDRIKKMNRFIYFFKGGTVMMSVDHVAESIVGAIEYGKGGMRYPCGDECVSWTSWLSWIQEAMDTDKKILKLPCIFGTIYGALMKRKEKKQGKEAGLNRTKLFKDIQCRTLCYDPTPTCEELHVSRGGLKESVIETVKRCLNEQ